MAPKYTRSRVSNAQRAAVVSGPPAYDPYAYEREQIAQELASSNQREQMKYQREQNEANQDVQAKQMKAQNKAGMMSGVGSIASMGLTYKLLNGRNKPPAMDTGIGTTPGPQTAYSPASTMPEVGATGAETLAPQSAYAWGGGQPAGDAATQTGYSFAPEMAAVDQSLAPAAGTMTVGGAPASATATTTSTTSTAAPSATAGIGSYATPAAIVAAVEGVKGMAGGMDKSWEERNTQQRTVSAPGTAGVLPGSTLVNPDTAYGKVGNFMARMEQGALEPIDKLFGIKNKGGTWLCTEINRYSALDEREQLSLHRLRKYSLATHPVRTLFYLGEGDKLVSAISKSIARECLASFYVQLKRHLVDPCISLVSSKDLEAAYQHYASVTESLYRNHAPTIKLPLEEKVLEEVS